MKKLNIEIKEFGAMGPDGYDIFVNGDPKYRTRYLKDAEAIEDIIGALMDARDALENTKKDYSKRQLRSYKVNNSLNKVDNALEKAGVDFG